LKVYISFHIQHECHSFATKKVINPDLFIHGAYQKATGIEFENINPATGKIISTFKSASPQQADEAVQSAEKGFLEWAAPTRRAWQNSSKSSADPPGQK